MDTIAEKRLVALYPAGHTAHVHLRVGRPMPDPDGDWGCEVAATGLRIWEGPKTFPGVDSWDALMSGVRFLHMMLSTEESRGVVFHWEDGRHPIRVDALFILHDIIAASGEGDEA